MLYPGRLSAGSESIGGAATYYGWTSLFVLVWIPAGYALYRAAGTIWPLVAGHALYDLLQVGQNTWPTLEALSYLSTAIAMTGAAVVYLGNTRYWRHRSRRPQVVPGAP